MKGPVPVSLAERFWPKVSKSDGCWEWIAQRDGKGYGKLRGPGVPGCRGKTIAASRASWLLHFGDIPPGLCICHKCDNPPCVRPDHLFLGTRRDNNQDAVAKGRNAKGDRNGQAKLSPHDVVTIRSRIARGDIQRAIARDYGVTFQLISEIGRGNLWKQNH